MVEPKVPGRRLARTGWIPMYHGAWAMIVVPPLLGVIRGGFVAAHVPLLATWWIGYLFFYAATLWLRSHGKKKYLRPVIAYGITAAVCGVAVWITAPYAWRWVPLFLPLIVYAAWAAWKRKDRALASGLDTTLAASLMLPVVWDVGSAGTAGIAASPFIWILTGFLFGYFGGTVFYVKTNIRERRSDTYLWISIVWHAAWCAAAVVCAAHGAVSWGFAAVWLVIFVRAIAVPLIGRHAKVPVAAIGVGELVISALILLAGAEVF